jgi:anti-sigma factor RsiW
MNCEAYQDLVAAHVDGVLTPAERQEVEYHLGSCERCRCLFAEEKRFHAAFAARRFTVPVPAEVEQRLRVALAAEGESPRPSWRRLGEWLGASPLLPRFALGLAAAGLLIALLLPRLFPSAPASDMLTQAVNYYQAVIEGRIALEYSADDPQGLETVFNHSGQLDFVAHVTDFRPAGYQLRGGKVERVRDRPMAVALYDGEDGQIVCLRQRGPMPPLPPGAERMKKSSLYTHAGHTLFFSQFPDHFCVLISRLPREAFLRHLALLPASS